MSSANGTCAPGSNDFFTSPNGTQTWIAYHARTDCSQIAWTGRRTRAQQISWDGNGNPVFPQPVNDATTLTLPAGDTGTLGNEIANASFEEDHRTGVTPSGWQVWAGTCGCNGNANFTEDGGGHSGTFRLAHWKAQAYQVYTHQDVTGLTDGTYVLSGRVQRSGTQGTVFLGIKGYQNGGGPETTVGVPATGTWTYIEAAPVQVQGGRATVGLYSNAPGGDWVRLDDVRLQRQ